METQIPSQVHASRAVNPVFYHCWWDQEKEKLSMWETKFFQAEKTKIFP
jgi:hypothetical protein